MSTESKAAATAFVKAHVPTARSKRGLALAEGVTLAQEALRGTWPVEVLVLAPERLDEETYREFRAEAGKRHIPVRELSPTEMARLSTQPAPPPAAAMVRPPERQRLSTQAMPDRVLVLDALSDPGNAGTLLRCAAGFGVAVVLAGGGVTPRNEKFLRASAGTAFHSGALFYGDDDAQVRAALKERRVVLLDPRASLSIAECAEQCAERFALVLGNEAHGVTEAQWPGAISARIPQRDAVESLNVAMSGAIALYEFTRSR